MRKCVTGALLSAALILAFAAPAGADDDVDIDALAQEMLTAKRASVRIRAALSLFEERDPRAVLAFVKALDDSSDGVRLTAAFALQKLGRAAGANQRKAAIAKLREVAANDKNKNVRRQAKKALVTTRKRARRASTTPAVAIDFGGMGRLGKAMRDVATRRFRRAAFAIEPVRSADYLVVGRVADLDAARHGATAIVSCRIRILVAAVQRKHKTMYLQATARVSTSNRSADITLAENDCVHALVADLVDNKIVPALQNKLVKAGTLRPAAGSLKRAPAAAAAGAEAPASGCRRGNAAECFAEGLAKLGVDDELAHTLLEEGCQAGETRGCVALGDVVKAEAEGESAPEAVELFTAACDDGDPGGCWELGKALLGGDGVDQDLERAVELFEKSCALGGQAGCDYLADAP